MIRTFAFKTLPVVFSCLAFPVSSFAQSVQDYTFEIKNHIYTPSQADEIQACKVMPDGTRNCQKLTSNITLNNPVVLDVAGDDIYVANYGFVKHGMSSFLLKCNLVDATSLTCKSILVLARADNVHLTGLKLTSDRIYLVKTLSLMVYKTQPDNPGSREFLGYQNFNELLTCQYPEVGGTGRISTCATTRVQPQPGIKIQKDFNTSMPMRIVNSDLFIEDPLLQTTFKCVAEGGNPDKRTCAADTAR